LRFYEQLHHVNSHHPLSFSLSLSQLSYDDPKWINNGVRDLVHNFKQHILVIQIYIERRRDRVPLYHASQAPSYNPVQRNPLHDTKRILHHGLMITVRYSATRTYIHYTDHVHLYDAKSLSTHLQHPQTLQTIQYPRRNQPNTIADALQSRDG
jgi:hypothetical protein